MAFDKMPNSNLSQRLAIDIQLRSEEKWILEALSSIRSQRNSLQIERLHLESLKARLVHGDNNAQEVPNVPASPSEWTSTAMDMMKNKPSFDFEVPVIGLEEAQCNQEELNLSVNNFMYQNQEQTYPIEEEDEDSDDDEEDDREEDFEIDMSMMMDGGLM